MELPVYTVLPSIREFFHDKLSLFFQFHHTKHVLKYIEIFDFFYEEMLLKTTMFC